MVAIAACVCLALCAAAATAAPPRMQEGEPCQPDKLTVYKVVLHTFWTRDKFPKHYPDWRPPAQWSKVFGECARLRGVAALSWGRPGIDVLHVSGYGGALVF